MPRYLYWIMVLCTCISFTGCSKKRPDGKETDARSISFEIYKGYKYNTKVYDCTFVQVHIIVEKVSAKSRIQVWDTTFEAKRLRQYPSSDKALLQTITVPAGTKAGERFEVRYILVYESKGSKLEMQDQRTIEGTAAKLSITI